MGGIRSPEWQHVLRYQASARVTFQGTGAAEYSGCQSSKRHRYVVGQGHTVVAVSFSSL